MVLCCLLYSHRGNLLAAGDDAQATIRNLQGNWVSIWSNTDCCKIDNEISITFKHNKINIYFKKGVDPFQGEFKIIPADKSGNGGIDISEAPKNKGDHSEIMKGTYILKRNTLILIQPEAGKPRPQDVKGAIKDDSVLFWVLVKENPKK